MKTIYLSLLLAFNISLLFCQIPIETQIVQLKSAIRNQEFEKAKLIINDFEGDFEDEGINKLKFLQQRILLAEAIENDSLRISLMEIYILNNVADQIYEQEKCKPSNIWVSIDSFNVFSNMSKYSIELANIYIKIGNYTKALHYLDIYESKYPFKFGCGLGFVREEAKKNILRSIIDQGLGNHEGVIHKLLSNNFEFSYKYQYLSYNIDSILYESIFKLYTEEQVKNELNRYINEMIKIGLQKGDFNDFRLKFFNIEIDNTEIGVRFNDKKEESKIHKIKDEVRRNELIAELYNESVRESVQNMRLFKLVAE